jgi:hypothetical protein
VDQHQRADVQEGGTDPTPSADVQRGRDPHPSTGDVVPFRRDWLAWYLKEERPAQAKTRQEFANASVRSNHHLRGHRLHALR